MSSEIKKGRLMDLMSDPSNADEGVYTAVTAVPSECPPDFHNVVVEIQIEESGLEPIQVTKKTVINCLSKQKGNHICEVVCPIGNKGEGGLQFTITSSNIGQADDHGSHI